MKIFTSPTIDKIFLIDDFFSQYESVLSNPQKVKRKEFLIDLVEMVKQQNIIEDDSKIIVNGMTYSTLELTPKNRSEGFLIFEKYSSQ